MLKKYNKKLKAKVKVTTARSDGKGKPKKGMSGGGSPDQAPKKAHTKKFCQRCKTHGGPHQRCYDKEGKPLSTSTGKPSYGKKPYKKLGATRT
jgi:hypothetical protein